MKLNLDVQLGKYYKSPTQKIRIQTENWVKNQIYCPACLSALEKNKDNKPVADFFCKKCQEEFELKSKKQKFGLKIVDGAYKTMLDRLKSSNNPSLFLLNYHSMSFRVINFIVIPKHYFIPENIEKRSPLSSNAQRAGWIGCNILIKQIPPSGRIYFIKNGLVQPRQEVINRWNRTLFLRKKEGEMKGWILDVMNCIEKLGKKEFTLSEAYNFEGELSIKHPQNKHIKDKIRQQLQYLRDKGYLEFIGSGRYKLSK
ncbi:MAG: restriction endonuclease [Candidatus Omnitrophica bacterium]|nr:restriction endonuclease [Candidatus Omnitrophota bacterium]